MSDYEIMEQSIFKNVQELSELCIDYGITNAYTLMEVVEKYYDILKQVKKNEVEIIELESESEE